MTLCATGTETLVSLLPQLVSNSAISRTIASSSPKNCPRNCPRTATDERGQSRTLCHNQARKVPNFRTFPHRSGRLGTVVFGFVNRWSGFKSLSRHQKSNALAPSNLPNEAELATECVGHRDHCSPLVLSLLPMPRLLRGRRV